MSTSIYVVFENFKNFDFGTSIYVAKTVRRRRKFWLFTVENTHFLIETASFRIQTVQNRACGGLNTSETFLRPLYSVKIVKYWKNMPPKAAKIFGLVYMSFWEISKILRKGRAYMSTYMLVQHCRGFFHVGSWCCTVIK